MSSQLTAKTTPTNLESIHDGLPSAGRRRGRTTQAAKPWRVNPRLARFNVQLALDRPPARFVRGRIGMINIDIIVISS